MIKKPLGLWLPKDTMARANPHHKAYLLMPLTPSGKAKCRPVQGVQKFTHFWKEATKGDMFVDNAVLEHKLSGMVRGGLGVWDSDSILGASRAPKNTRFMDLQYTNPLGMIQPPS